MSLLSICQWIQTTALSTAIREGALYYPILGAIHLLAIGWFGGMVLMGDLSVLGIGLRGKAYPQFLPWKWVGFVLVLASGGLLWWSEPVVCYKSVSFQIKMALLILVGLNSFFVRKRAPQAGACLSLLLWIALVFAGRGIAFF